jgi:hypothetical protein
VTPSLTLSETEAWIIYTVNFLALEITPLIVVELLIVARPRKEAPDDIRTAYHLHYHETVVSSKLPAPPTTAADSNVNVDAYLSEDID